MSRGRFWFFVGSWLCSSCTSSLESRSSGQIGCRPQDITISEASTDQGLLDSTQTWVAECAGRRFMCSEREVAQLGREVLASELTHTSAGGVQVSCMPIVGEEDESPRVAPSSTPPVGAAGFDFGWSLGRAKRACESAGHEWTKGKQGRRSCSGPAVELGFDAGVQVLACQGSVCEITVVARPRSDWVGAIVGVQAALRDKYGAPTDEARSVGQGCKDHEVQQCIADGRLRISDDWKWRTRERLRLLVMPPEPDQGPPAIRIIYTKPPSETKVQGSAL